MIRTLYELSLKSARRYQSEQTHLLHWYPHAYKGETHDTIPLLQNFLFVLALFRSRISDNLTEGKNLLEKLLHFQNPDGNFPLFLHQYPVCHDRTLAIQLLPIFFWIDREFQSIMQPALKEHFQQAQERLHTYAKQAQQQKPFPYPYDLILAAATKDPSLASLLENGEEREEWWSTEAMSLLLIALQMTGPDWEKGTWSSFWEHIGHSWNTQSYCYIGPMLSEKQEGSEPQATLYDLWMGLFQGEFSNRSLTPSINHLFGALIRPVASPCPFLQGSNTLEGHWQKGAWRAFTSPFFSLALAEKKQPLPPSQGKQFAFLRAVWGNREQTHSCVCQGDRTESVTWKKGEGAGELLFTLSKDIELEDKKKSREILLHVDQDPNTRIEVDGKYATVFFLGQTVCIQSGTVRLSFIFSIEKGEGDFVGHIMPGNRPSQVLHTTGQQTFDWMIFLRTLRRSEECTIRLQVFYTESV